MIARAVSMTVGLGASVLAIGVGALIGMSAAYFPRLDTVIGMVVDLSMSLPILPLMIVVAAPALAGPSMGTLVVVIAAFAWPDVARVVRSQALSVVRLPYMDAARVIGGRHRCWWNTLLAQSLGINESTVRRRFEALMSRGCIQLVTLVPAALLRYETEVILWLDVAPARLDALAHELAGHRGVRFIAATLGQTSPMCEVIMPTTSDLFTFTTSTLAGLEGIRSWQASIEMTTLKRGFVHLPWAYERLS